MVLYVLIEHIGYRLRAELIEFAVHRGQRKNLSTLAEAFPSLSLVIFRSLSDAFPQQENYVPTDDDV